MRLNLHQKIVLGAILPTALVLGLLGLLTLLHFYQSEQRVQRAEVRMETARRADQLSLALRLAAADAERSADLFALRDELPEAELRSWLDRLLARPGVLYGLGLRYADGRALYRSRAQTPSATGAAGAADPDWFREVKAGGKPQWTAPDLLPGPAPSWVLAYLVPFYRDGQFAGALRAELRLDLLPRLLAADVSTAASDWLLLDTAGRVLYAREASRLGRPYTDFAPAGSAAAALIAGQLHEAAASQRDLSWPGLDAAFVGTAVVEATGWRLFHARSQREVAQLARPGQALLAGLLLLAVLVGSSLALVALGAGGSAMTILLCGLAGGILLVGTAGGCCWRYWSPVPSCTGWRAAIRGRWNNCRWRCNRSGRGGRCRASTIRARMSWAVWC